MTKLELNQIRQRIESLQLSLSRPEVLTDAQIDYSVGELGLLIDVCEKAAKRAKIKESGMRLIK